MVGWSLEQELNLHSRWTKSLTGADPRKKDCSKLLQPSTDQILAKCKTLVLCIRKTYALEGDGVGVH